jgi:Pentapeptide repeats (8 copies)
LFLLIFVRGEVPTQLGVGLVTGAVFAAAAYLAQTNFEQRSYINSLTTAGDLPGFDDLGKNLNGATLAARNMRNAQLVDAKLEEANLADTSLNSADLIRAKLSRRVPVSRQVRRGRPNGCKPDTGQYSRRQIHRSRARPNHL